MRVVGAGPLQAGEQERARAAGMEKASAQEGGTFTAQEGAGDLHPESLFISWTWQVSLSAAGLPGISSGKLCATAP